MVWLKRTVAILLILVVGFSSVHPVYASGEAKQEKNFFEKSWDALKNIFSDTAKAVQEATNNTMKQIESLIEDDFNCGWMEPICFMEEWLLKQATYMMKSSLETLLQLLSLPSKLFPGNDLLEHSVVGRYYGYMESIAWSFLYLFFVFHLIKFLFMYGVYESAAEFKLLLRKLLITAILIAYLPDIFKKLFSLNVEIVDAFRKTGIGLDQFANLGQALSKVPIMIILYFILGALFIVVCVQFAMLIAEIIFLFVLGPIVIATNLNKEFNLFPAWWKSVLVAIFTSTIQLMMIYMMVSIVMQEDAMLLTLIFAIGFMSLIIRSPQFLKEWMYSTGAGGMISGPTKKVATNMAGKAGKAAGGAVGRVGRISGRIAGNAGIRVYRAIRGKNP